MKQVLVPTLDDLRAEHVLVQAWKKTASYLRQHSWYADTLELDYQSLRLPQFIGELQERLQVPDSWEPSPLEFVPAPKSQTWLFDGGAWKPKSSAHNRIRPLAHVSLSDQVLATAMLLCLADRVEQTMGDPLLPVEQNKKRKEVLAYGHRLLCDSIEGNQRHRWGSSKLYRLFFRDYQTFLQRPEVVMEQLKSDSNGYEVTVVQSDLSKFYDRVRPALLYQKVQQFAAPEDVRFFALFQKVFAWGWKDKTRAQDYSRHNGIEGFESVALPQGLVASGFFANVAIHDVDLAIREYFDRPIDAKGNFVLKDACYYVDDFRLVLLTKPGAHELEIESAVIDWLQGLLNQHAGGLVVERSKTKAMVANRQERFLVQQSKAAKRIQRDVSGVFDMLHGSELIGAIEGFFHTQKRYPSQAGDDADGTTGFIVGISDMRDDTAARFAAGKYRRTFRSLRPLLQNELPVPDLTGDMGATIEMPESSVFRLVLSKQQLDERGQLFSAMLIEEWVCDPSNVRLLRIALDLYPDVRFLDKILKLLEPGWKDGGSRGANREVRLYCLAELFRAGATETGIVSDQECLPAGLEIQAYHERLQKEATNILLGSIASPSAKKCFPWYLLQQVFLYLAAQNHIPEQIISPSQPKHRELARYQRFARFMADQIPTSLQERAIYLILAYTAFGHEDTLQKVASSRVSSEFLRKVCEISPETARGLWGGMKEHASAGQRQMARSLGLEPASTGTTSQSLADHVVREYNPFWQEDNLLRLALGLLEKLPDGWPDVLSPWQVQCEISASTGSMFGRLKDGTISISSNMPRASHLFSPPSWCESREEKQRFQLGILLRFALRGSVDFYSNIQERRARSLPSYHLPASHWEKQRSATFQGRTAFGPPWIPISSWVEDFLFDLLRWPGSAISSPVRGLRDWTELLKQRVARLARLHGPAAQLSFLEQAAPWPDKPSKEWQRPLRVGIVQSVIPNIEHYRQHLNDPELLADPTFRASQRRHLASVMEAVNQMIRLRETHQSQTRSDGRVIDLLVFPELAIHPLDIDTFILPFIRTHKCMVLFGQVYHRANLSSGAPLINSCLWMIPEWSSTAGFQIKRVEQGKENLTRPELAFTPQPSSFRPAQWIIEYHWSSRPENRPLKLSASVCYDATDLALASDLKSRSDVYIVCALNKDVGTFDRMSEGLHYHMYQGVIVVNNGQFGGSSFYMPFRELHHRQVFHLHGQPQASIAFAEITPDKLINRLAAPDANPIGVWKTPPANWEPI
jgi:hypothetical protein